MTDTRRIQLDGAPNFRDLGGYTAADGRTVKKGLVFRSDDLNDLSQDDLDVVSELGVRTVVDFRDHKEIADYPDRLPETATNLVALPIGAGRLMAGFSLGRLDRDKTTGIMISVYRALVNDFQYVYHEFFSLLANPDNLPLLFHCTAGKDRTGLAAALFLSALGVKREIIEEDYLLSNVYLQEKYVFGIDYDEVMEPMYTVSPEFIQASFAVIDGSYGGVERYLLEKLGVDISRFREMYTEKQ